MDIQTIKVIGDAVSSVNNTLLVAYVTTLVSRYMMKRLDVIGPVFLSGVAPAEQEPPAPPPAVLSVTR